MVLLTLLLSACASYPPITLKDWNSGLDTQWLSIEEHQLLRLKKPAEHPSAIHIYLEGDGTPWVNRYFIAQNPTPRYPLALALMKRDEQLGFYIGRPCYYQEPLFYKQLAEGKTSSPCNFHYWTDARYSDNIVALMSRAITITLEQLPANEQSLPVILIGHSGGGTLAMLVAQRVAAVDGVITIAANMDTDAWTEYQHYSPLKKSINPATILPLRHIAQVHFAGSADEVVPPKINADLMKKMNQQFMIKEGFTHSCCWLNEWPELLSIATEQMNLNQQLP